MVYGFQLQRNPKSLLVPGMAVVLVLAAVAVIVFYHPLLGVLALAVAGYISYHLVKFFANTIKSHVRTSDDGMVCMTAMGTESKIGWDELTHAGWYTTDSGYQELFVYAEGDDKLLSIPPQYEQMMDLEQEILEKADVAPLALYGDEVDGLADALRAHIAPEGEVIDDDEPEP